jgi:hypothetical protein
MSDTSSDFYSVGSRADNDGNRLETVRNNGSGAFEDYEASEEYLNSSPLVITDIALIPLFRFFFSYAMLLNLPLI